MLIRSKEGKNTMRVVGLETYERNASEWRKLLQRQDKASAMLAELTEITDGSFEKITKPNKVDSKSDETDQFDLQTKIKRRRKRSGKTEIVMGEDGEVTSRVTKKKKQATKIIF